jgi:hypothetical protein
MEPFTMALIAGGINATTGALGAFGKNAAARQKYADDLAFQQANNRFSSWQAGLNARVADANAQYKYWESTFNYNQSKAFANSQRNVEFLKEAEQARVVFETRANAGAAYVSDSSAISDGYMEAEMAAAVAQQQYTWRAMQARSSVQALNVEGNSVDRMVNNYAMQLGDQMTLESINKGIRDRQYTRAQAGAVTQYLSRYNSQDFYNPTEVLDPIKPFPPLPTMISPPPPSRVGAPPSQAAFLTNLGTAALGGIATGFSTYGSMNALKTPSAGSGPGTPGSGIGGAGGAALLTQIQSYLGD